MNEYSYTYIVICHFTLIFSNFHFNFIIIVNKIRCTFRWINSMKIIYGMQSWYTKSIRRYLSILSVGLHFQVSQFPYELSFPEWRNDNEIHEVLAFSEILSLSPVYGSLSWQCLSPTCQWQQRWQFVALSVFLPVSGSKDGSSWQWQSPTCQWQQRWQFTAVCHGNVCLLPVSGSKDGSSRQSVMAMSVSYLSVVAKMAVHGSVCLGPVSGSKDGCPCRTLLQTASMPVSAIPSGSVGESYRLLFC